MYLRTKMRMPVARRCTAAFLVRDAEGLHARPAALLVRTAQQYEAEIVIRSGSRTADAKSIIGLLTLEAPEGTTVTVTAEGGDAVEAVRAIESLFARSFHAAGAEPGAESRGTEGSALEAVRPSRAFA